MADVQAVFGTLLALGIAFPGMLTAWWLLFPTHIERAGDRLENNPWRCLGIGTVALIPLVLVVSFFSALPLGLARFLGAVLGFGGLAFASLGASGIAGLMGRRLNQREGSETMSLWTFVRGAIALELAAVFPLIGWFIMIPVSIVTAFGASLLAVLNWVPKLSAEVAAGPSPSQA
jgi:hypothetical protein